MTSTIKSVIPQAELLEQEFLEIGDKGLACFCLYNMPKGSVLTDEKGGKFDSMRGVICFLNDSRNVTILSYQSDFSFTCPNILLPDRKEVCNRYRSTLVDAACSFKVEK